MTGNEFLSLSKEAKQRFVRNSITCKKDTLKGKVYFIRETACCQNYVEWPWGQASKTCPKCGATHWQKPALEHFLFVEQDKFLEEYPDTRILGETMFPLIVDYAKNLIQSFIKGNISMDEKDLDEKAVDAATLLVEVILKDPNHCMRWSFGEYLKRLCKSVIFRNKNSDHEVSLNAVLNEGSDNELGGQLIVTKYSGAIGKAIRASSSEAASEVETVEEPEIDIAAEVTKIVGQANTAIWQNSKSYKDCVLFLIGMIIKFKERDDRCILSFFDETGTQTKKFVEKGEYLIYSYLRNLTEMR